MKLDTAKAKGSWVSAKLNEKGIQAVSIWIDQLAENIQSGQGRWDAYASFATYKSDPIGSVQLLSSAVKTTSKP